MAKNDLGRGSERAEQPDLYSGYAATKGWTGAPAPGFDADMDSLAEQIGMHSGAVLEIGFGNGDFLNWAKSRGYSVAGFEIQPSLVAQAAAPIASSTDNNSPFECRIAEKQDKGLCAHAA